MLRGLKPYGCQVILGDDARSRADWFAREFEVLSGVRLEQLKRQHGPQDEPAGSRMSSTPGPVALLSLGR